MAIRRVLSRSSFHRGLREKQTLSLESFLSTIPEPDGTLLRMDENRIRQALIASFEDVSLSDRTFLARLDRLVAQHGKTVYSVLIRLMTQLEFQDEEAHQTWLGITQHKVLMEKRLGRPVNWITAVCDYLMAVKKSFNNPKMVELKTFEQAEHYSKNDALTGLFNRGYFENALSAEVGRSLRYETEFSLVFFDFDDFKSINDTLGHPAGDFILTQVAQLILKEKRGEDVAARFGGEEFVLLLPETSKAHARLKAERIRQKVAETVFSYRGRPVRVTLSAGVATFPIDSSVQEEVLECADRALYRAKSRGKNHVCLFSSEQRNSLRQEHSGMVTIHPMERPVSSCPSYGRLRDLSLSGIRFEALEPMGMDSRIQMDLPIPSENKTIRVLGEVKRIQPLEDTYEIGVRFLDIKKEDRLEINSYFTNLLESELSAC